MFANHQPALARLGRSSPQGLERIATFALCTIRWPLRLAVADYPLVRRGDHAQSIFGAKHNGLAYLRQHAADLWERCEYAFTELDDDDAADTILGILTEVPSLGPAKAGFTAQMIYGLSGCIDTHNLTRFNLPARHFEAQRHRSKFYPLLHDYNSFCRRAGGTEALWDGWCTYLAGRDPVNYASAEIVSALHLCPLEL